MLAGAGAAGLAGAGAVFASLDARAAELDRDPTLGRDLVFEDQFEHLDREIWNAGPKVSNADPGYYGRSAFARFGGEEGFDPYAIVDDPDASGGTALQISAKFIGRTMTVRNYYGNDQPEFQWISGNLQTSRRDGTVTRAWRHGYFETRMLFPRHPLTWPAFWLMNRCTILAPSSAIEVDVVEHKGFEPHDYGAYLHEWGEPGARHDGSAIRVSEDMTAGYNRYGVLLVDDLCAVYFNRRLVRNHATGVPAVWAISRSAEMDLTDDAFWPLITLAILPDYPFPDPLMAEHRETRMRVDYFQVYA
ncbi:family 16 glycosylhydrolase [Frigidibacter sp. MR17.14]|uniref:glycoside hydrolase family 16 protein n=1 Tax=Frigidibacter sp. MR17.14 TaxID=3126509 RepID=UPI003012B076